MINFNSWCSFQLSKIFSISKYGDVENVRVLKPGFTNYISTTRYNNGLAKKVENTKYKVEKGNCITVGIDGSFKAFYQEEAFIRTTNISILRNEKLNKYNALFLITIINKAIEKYYYGVKLKQSNELENTSILLPSIDGQVDWTFMTNFIKPFYDSGKAKLCTKNTEDLVEIDFSRWKTVRLIDYFDYERGQRYKKEDHTAGTLEYISSTEFNNGVDAYVSKGPKSKIYRNALTLANSGSVGKVFYHESAFVASDHVHVLTLKGNKQLNRKIALFMIPIIEKNAIRFLFNKEITERTIPEIEISLPFKNNEIDFDFIEKYMSKIPNFDLLESEIERNTFNGR